MTRMLGSAPFARAPKMQKFLAFLVHETLAGRAAQLKEYTIAINVLGKPNDFEPGTSAAVRVEAGRLRKLLMQYRVEHGSADRIVLDVPKGSYVPTFRYVASEPPSAAEQAPAAAPAGQAWSSAEERRWVTVLSCALGDEISVSRCGITSEFLQSFDLFYSKCTSVAKRHGGYVEGNASDRLIVYFGWPNALEDAAGRALTAALEMLAQVQTGLGQAPLGIRIGIATSEVVTRRVDPAQEAARPQVVGEAPSLAMKILPTVPLNGILVAESTRQLTGASFEFIAAGSLDERADESPLLWRLLRPTSQTRFRARQSASQAAMVGRREEVALVMSRWQLSLQSEGQGVLVSGEAGIGKSRLVESVLETIAESAECIRVQCSPHHTNSTLYPFIELIKNELDAAQGTAITFDERLGSYLAQYGLHEPTDHALLAALVSEGGEEGLTALSASQQKDLTLNLVAHLLRTKVGRRPTVLLGEDIHWADPTTSELLQDILRMAADIRLLILLTSRDGAMPGCSQNGNLTSIRLTRLPRKDCNDLIDRVLSDARLAPATRTLILEKAEGIPLFLEELTKLVLAAERGTLRDSSVPGSLSDLLASQLDRLGSRRNVAQAAAVIGRQFTREMLALASGYGDHIDTALDQLIAAGVMVREGAPASNIFAFRHALLRDAAYDSILDTARRELHQRIGGLLIDSFPEVAAEHPEIVAGHMMDAARFDEAIPFWIDAGRKAAGRYALPEATADFRRALQALQSLPVSRENRERELEVLIELGRVIRHARGYGDEELLTIYERGRALSAELGMQDHLANVVYGLWTHAAGRGQWPKAVQLATEFQNLCRQMDDSQLEVEAFRLLGASAAFRGEFAIARRHFDRALATYDVERHGPRFGFDPGAACAAYLSWTAWHLGQREEARTFAATALAICERKNHASTLAMVLSWLMFYEICEKNVDAVRRHNERLQAVCSERDCRYWQPFGAACAEWAAFQQDRNPRRLEKLLESAAQFRERYLTSCLLLLGADICRELDRPEQGLELTAAALQFIEEHDERVWEAECSRLTAELLLQAPAPDVRRARKLLQSAVKTARHQEAVSLERRAAASLSGLTVTYLPLQ
jgi:class 3 adenylate cyclase